jgi:phenylalanyl-tRNA synthetase beta chain
MLLTGQPLHMYDLDKVKGKDFNVELSSALVKGLDEKDYQLKDDLGIVINGQFGCIAGVFGGLDTSISQDTKNIFIESAIFDNNSIRKTSLKLDLQSDSSQRFIRGIDKNRTYLASKLAVSLIKPYLTLEKGISKEIIYDVLKELPVTVSLTLGQTNKLLGTDYKVNDIQEVFDRLDFKYTLEKETFLVNVPSHRKDITIYQDLIEEIIRLKGFNTLKEVNIQSETHGLLSFRQQQLDLIRNTLTAQGLFENISYILLKEDNANDFNIFSQAQSLKILNPLNLERHELRRSIIPSLLINRDYNLKRQVSQTEIFEIGNIFSSESGQLHLGILIDELYNQTNWLNNKKADFYTMKGLVLNVLTLLGVNLNRVKITPYDLQDSFYHPGKSALISFDKKVIGVIGYLHTLALKKYDLSKEVIVSEIVLDDLLNAKTNQIVFIEPSIYPTINRDIAFLIRDEIKAADIIQTIKRIGKSMIKEIEVFDVYKGNNIPEGLKSLALSLVFCSNERTLTSEEINILMSNIIKELENKYQIILRK